MAADGDEENMFQLLPSDYKGIEAAEKYATTSRIELDNLKLSVGEMGWFRTLMDSKVPRNRRGIFNVSFSHTDPEKIKEEIGKCLEFYENVINSVKKIDNKEKSKEESENPYRIMINLKAEMTRLITLAESRIQNTDSKTVSRLYSEFIAKEKELENEIKKLECAFLKQREAVIDRITRDAARAAEGARAHQEQRMTAMAGEVNDLRNDNEELRKKLDKLTERLDAL